MSLTVETIPLRSGTTTEWAASGLVLGAGELGVDLTVPVLKIGDGTHTFADLPDRDTGQPTGPLPQGQRAAPGLVGYLGDTADLFEINYPDDFTGTPLEGIAVWDGDDGVLRINGSDVVIEGMLLNVLGVYHGSGTNLTIRDSVIHAIEGGDNWFGISAGQARGTLTVQDCTVVCDTGPGADETYSVGIIADGVLVALRNDVSGCGDGIQGCGTPGGFETATRIEQNHIHDLSYLDEAQHLDAIQVYNATATNTDEDTFLTISGNHVVGQEGSPSGVAINSSATMGRPPAESTLGPPLSVVVDNNYLGGGAFHLRLGFQMVDVEVTNNNFGATRPDPDPAGEFGYASVEEAASVATWTNNRTGSGPAGSGTIVPNPNP